MKFEICVKKLAEIMINKNYLKGHYKVLIILLVEKSQKLNLSDDIVNRLISLIPKYSFFET